MQASSLWIIFVTVFLAELGDKTQLAALLFASDKKMPWWSVFFAAASALVLSTLLAVLVGKQIGEWISPQLLTKFAGIGFIAIGVWVLLTSQK